MRWWGLLSIVLVLAGCSDKRQLGESCIVDNECASGLCFGQCLAPELDADGDGIANGVERRWGSDPLKADSDDDGKPDEIEYGTALATGEAPPDADDDGIIDAADSAIDDVDGDCIADELDSEEDTPNITAQHIGDYCGVALSGICAAPTLAGVEFSCRVVDGVLVPEAVPCNFAAVAGYDEVDDCDGVDSDCDGETDEDCVQGCGASTAFDGQNVVFVAKRGSDTDGDGSLANPFLTITHGLANANGARILIGAGDYEEQLVIPGEGFEIAGGFDDCNFDQIAEGGTNVITNDATPALEVPANTWANISRVTFSGVERTIQGSGGNLICDACIVAARAGHAVEVTAEQVSFINSVVTVAAQAGASADVSAVHMLGSGRLSSFNTLLQVGGDGGRVAPVIVDGGGNMQIVNSMLAVRAGSSDERAGLIRVAGAPPLALQHNDFTLDNGEPPVLNEGAAMPMATLNGGAVPGSNSNLALGCAPVDAPWELAANSPCIDRGADPTGPNYGIGYAPHMVDRKGVPRRLDPEGGDGYWDIGPDEVDKRDQVSCGGNDGLCSSGTICLEGLCTGNGQCVKPLAPGRSDLDGDGVCDALDVDADEDGEDADTDCDDTDPTVFTGATEICGDGAINDCSDPARSVATPDTIYVAPGDAGGAGTVSDPVGSYGEAVGLAVSAGNAFKVIAIAGGVYEDSGSGPSLNQDTWTIRGGLRADCDFASGGTRTVLKNNQTVIDVTAAEATVENLTALATGADIMAVRLAGPGSLTLRQVVVRTESGNSVTGVAAIGGGTLVLDRVDVATGPAGISNNAVVVGSASAAITDSKLVTGVTLGADSIGLDVSGASSNVVIGRTTLGVRGNGVGVKASGGELYLYDSLVAVDRPPVAGIALQVDGARPMVVGSHLGVHARDLANVSATAVELVSGGAADAYFVNTSVFARVGVNGTAAAFDVKSAWNATTHFIGNAIAAFVDSAVPQSVVLGDGSTTDVAGLETTCGGVGTFCGTTSDNVPSACGYVPSSARITPSTCLDAGVDPATVAGLTVPPETLDIHREERVTGLARDIGPDEATPCTSPSDCAIQGDLCTSTFSCGGYCVYNDVVVEDDDADFICNGADRCSGTPGGQLDADGDGCHANVDCDDFAPETYPGAEEAECGDGIVNGCAGGGIVEGAIYVDPTADPGGDGSPGAPFNLIEDGWAALGDGAPTLLMIAAETIDSAVSLTEQDVPGMTDETIQGGLDPTCDWAPAGFTRVQAAGTTGMHIGPASADIRISGFQVEVTESIPDSAAFYLTGSGLRHLERFEAITPSNTGGTNHGVRDDQGGTTALVLEDGLITVGEGPTPFGVQSTAAEVRVEGCTIDVGGPAAGPAVGIDANTPGPTRLIGNRVQATGQSPSTFGVRLVDTSAQITNSGIAASDVAVFQSAGGLSLVGSALSAPTSVQVNPDGADPVVQLVNTFLSGDTGVDVANSGDGVAALEFHHNVFDTPVVLNVAGSPAVGVPELNLLQFPLADDASGNVSDNCGLAPPDWDLSKFSDCAILGTDPALHGVFNEAQERDIDGARRPDGNGLWSVGPDQKTTDGCADSDNDGVCNLLDGCPGGADGSLGTDADGDGCWAPAEDCVDTDPDIYVGAPEACNGIDNDCSHGGITFAPPGVDVFYVSHLATGDGLSPGNPAGSIDAVLAQTTVTKAVILVAGGFYDETLDITDAAYPATPDVTIQGSADPTCAWEPVVGQDDEPDTFLQGASPVLRTGYALGNTMTFRDIHFLTTTAGQTQRGVLIDTADVGTRVFERVHVTTTNTDDSPGTQTYGIDLGTDAVAVLIKDSFINPGSAQAMRGVFSGIFANVQIDGSTVAMQCNIGSATGIRLTGAGLESVTNSTVRVLGGACASNGIFKVGGPLHLLNTTVDVQGGGTATGVNVTSTGDLEAVGLYINATASSSDGMFLQATGAGTVSKIVNTIFTGDGNQLHLDAQNGAEVLVAHNAFGGSGLPIQAPVDPAADVTEVNLCDFESCDPQSGGNIGAICPLPPPDYTMAVDSLCALDGIDPTTVGVTIPGTEFDRDGQWRPGANGDWALGPDEP